MNRWPRGSGCNTKPFDPWSGQHTGYGSSHTAGNLLYKLEVVIQFKFRMWWPIRLLDVLDQTGCSLIKYPYSRLCHIHFGGPQEVGYVLLHDSVDLKCMNYHKVCTYTVITGSDVVVFR